MSNIKSIEKIINLPPMHWVGDGFRVHNFIPQVIAQERVTPFIMMDHGAKFVFPPSLTPRGVGVHPHRGFETVTIAYKGKVAHHDSAGNSGIIEEGGVQWMTAGSGILHKEYHEKKFSKAGGEFQMVQLWVNLPSQHKMTTPNYQGLEQSQFPVVELENGLGKIQIISGEYQNNIGPATTFSPINLWNVHLKSVQNKVSNGEIEKNRIANGDELDDAIKSEKLILPKNFNTMMLVVEGEATVNSQNIQRDQMVLFKNDGEVIELSTNSEATILLLSGEPINEPIFSYGPFVMNTKEEIIQAFEDLQNGKFGYLE